jgi:hypothetical protein
VARRALKKLHQWPHSRRSHFADAGGAVLREISGGCVCSGRCERAVSADIHRCVEQCRFLLREFRVEPRTRQGLDGVRNVARPATVRLRPNLGQRKR